MPYVSLTSNQLRLLGALGRESEPGSVRSDYDERRLRALLRTAQLRQAGFRIDGQVEPIWGTWSGRHDELPKFRLVETRPARNRAKLVKVGGSHPSFERVIELKITTLLRNFQPVRG